MAIIHQGPFDGILGFSQGACLASIIASRASRTDLPKKLQPNVSNLVNFAILFSGFVPRDQALQKQYLLSQPRSICINDQRTLEVMLGHMRNERPLIPLPSLHIVAANDTVVAADAARALFHCFQDAETIEHNDDHTVSFNHTVVSACKSFLRRFRACNAEQFSVHSNL